MYGTSAEHSVLYNYQISNASNVYMALIQTETPYFQSNPDATTPFTSNSNYSDPVFSGSAGSNKAWGLRIVDSDDVFVYGAGLYSFFVSHISHSLCGAKVLIPFQDNYSQTCLETESCQDNMVDIENSGTVHMYGLSTKAAVNMVTVDGKSAALGKDNVNNFCSTLSVFQETGTTSNNATTTKC